MRGSKRKNIYASIRLKHILTESDLSKVFLIILQSSIKVGLGEMYTILQKPNGVNMINMTK